MGEHPALRFTIILSTARSPSCLSMRQRVTQDEKPVCSQLCFMQGQAPLPNFRNEGITEKAHEPMHKAIVDLGWVYHM